MGDLGWPVMSGELQSVRAERVFRSLVWVNAVIVALYAGLFAIHTFVTPLPSELTHAVNMNRESTIATWFAAALLSAAGVLALIAATITDAVRERRGWVVLALGVTYLAIDEVTLIHERFPQMFSIEGDVGTHAWLLPAIPIVAAGLVGMGFFLRHLPGYMHRPLLVALAVYAAGAVVIEGLTGFLVDDLSGAWWDTIVFPATIAVEESLEFIGVMLVIRALVAHLDRLGTFDGAPAGDVRTTP